MTPPIKPVNVIRAVWTGDRRFRSGRPGQSDALIDGDSVAGQSPPDALLSALATCSAVDVVDILAKRRTPVSALEVEVAGERRATHPRRFLSVDLTFQVTGTGIERIQAERAVALSLERYCSVASSLAPDVVVRTVVTLNGERGEWVEQKVGR
jgi:putative redox protein